MGDNIQPNKAVQASIAAQQAAARSQEASVIVFALSNKQIKRLTTLNEAKALLRKACIAVT